VSLLALFSQTLGGDDNLDAIGGTALAVGLPPGNVTVSFETDGEVRVTDADEADAKRGSWITPEGNASSDFQIRATLESGTTPDIGTIGAWENLGTKRTWGWTSSDASCTLTIELRRGTGATQSSQTWALTRTTI
jgi:hypothetical protein